MPGDADLIFCNGTIFDGHEFLPAGTAVRVRAGEHRRGRAGRGRPGRRRPGTEIVDLAGGTLLPGFIDAHMHPVFAGDQLRRCDLSGAVTLPEYLAIIRDYVDRNPGDGWVTGGGWSMEAFPGGIPTAAPLDEIVLGPPGLPAEPRRPRRLGQQQGAPARRDQPRHPRPGGRPDRA